MFLDAISSEKGLTLAPAIKSLNLNSLSDNRVNVNSNFTDIERTLDLNQKYLEISEDEILRPSDRVRDHAKAEYIDPAKKAGKRSLTLRAGDIHKELGFSRRIPTVCSALRSRKLQKNCNIELTYVGGPNNSTTTTFTYRLQKD